MLTPTLSPPPDLPRQQRQLLAQEERLRRALLRPLRAHPARGLAQPHHAARRAAGLRRVGAGAARRAPTGLLFPAARPAPCPPPRTSRSHLKPPSSPSPKISRRRCLLPWPDGAGEPPPALPWRWGCSTALYGAVVGGMWGWVLLFCPVSWERGALLQLGLGCRTPRKSWSQLFCPFLLLLPAARLQPAAAPCLRRARAQGLAVLGGDQKPAPAVPPAPRIAARRGLQTLSWVPRPFCKAPSPLAGGVSAA